MESRRVKRRGTPYPASARRDRERGFTLIEAVVSISVLGLMMAAVAAAYTLALRTIGTRATSTCPASAGCPADRLAAAHDVSVFEQLLGQDGARAACIWVPSLGATKYGSCSAGFTKVTNCSTASVCVGWPQVSTSSCHVAVYSTTGSGTTLLIKRTEYSVPVSSGVAAPVFATRVTAGTVGLAFPSSGFKTTLDPDGHLWVRTLTVQIKPTGISNGQVQTVALHPYSTDPDGGASAITTQGNPC
jgi:prepilin-type N-terminal cleavage/methylation domain-containing protein